MLTRSQKLNLVLCALLESSIVLSLGYWGYTVGHNTASRIFFLVLFPLVGFGIWGAIDFHQIRKNAEYFRLVQELVISFVASYGLFVSGQTILALCLAALTIIYHLLIYLSGERLLKKR